jgi:cholesterol oxidase
MYGPLYEHEQLNRPVHDAIHEMFGVTSLTVFEQLARMVRLGHAVKTDGTTYLRDLERLAIPITYIHGEVNRCFLPASTQATFDLLSKTNGGDRYRRIVVPGYGDIDCVIGKNAAHDVFPLILNHLQAQTGQAYDAAASNAPSAPSPAVR